MTLVEGEACRFAIAQTTIQVTHCQVGSIPALVFSDQSLGLGVFDLQTFCLALGISQSLAHNPAQCLGLLPVPGKKKKQK